MFQQGHALLIGVGHHLHHREVDIPITTQDVQAVADVLCDSNICGYPVEQVQLLIDSTATRTGILSAFDELAKQVGKQSTVFLFFCGHGALGTDGNYYLVSHDVHFQNGRVVAGSGISEAELLQKLRAIQAERLLLVIDSCYSGSLSPSFAPEPVSRDLRLISAPPETTMAFLSTGSGRIMITSCRENQVSYIGGGTLSIFTQALVNSLCGKGVSNNHGMISVFDLYEQLYYEVQETVASQIHATQEPELTVLKGVGPFAVALYKGATTVGSFVHEPVPQGLAAREVSSEKSMRYFNKLSKSSNDGVNIVGNVANEGGNFVGQSTVGSDSITNVRIEGSINTAIGREAKVSFNYEIEGAKIAQYFEPLLLEVKQTALPEQREEAVHVVHELQKEAAKGPQANYSRLTDLVDNLLDLVPSAVSTVIGIFATPLLSSIAGNVTQYIVTRLQRKTSQP